MQATKPKIEDTAESLSNINNLSYLNSESIESQILIKTRWELSDKLFNILKNNKTKKIKSILDFKIIENNDVRENLINFAYYSVRNDYLSLGTVVYYLRKEKLKRFNNFLCINNIQNKTYKEIISIEGIFDKFKEYLRFNNYDANDVRNHSFLVQVPRYLFEIDIKNKKKFLSKDDDILDVRNIPGAKYSKHCSYYTLNFSPITNEKYKQIVKEYIHLKITTFSLSTCASKLKHTATFLNYINKYKVLLKDINRGIIERYIAFIKKDNKNMKDYIIGLEDFIRFCQIKAIDDAPTLGVNLLIFKEDKVSKNQHKHNYKHIEEDVLEQLENHIEDISPKEYIPVIILLRASGWRISDVLNLKYDNCLDSTLSGYYLCGDIQKTKVLEHRIPISSEIADVVKASISLSANTKGNTNRYLFVTESGKRKGYPYNGKNIGLALNRLAEKYNILDRNGKLFRFKSHAFRHTKAVELINNGMNLLHVQKWLAHLTPIMTLHYAKILDNTMRKSWEEATRDGMFKLDGTGKALRVELSDIQDEDIIEWEWIKHNLDAVRMPLGYCMKPNKMECATQLNPCLTCRSLCTTPEFIPAFEQEIYQTKEIINKGKSQNRTFWVEKNELLLNKLESVLSVLKGGKIKHDAGKQGREYVGKQRK